MLNVFLRLPSADTDPNFKIMPLTAQEIRLVKSC